MFPTGRDIEYMAEVRRTKRLEADRYREVKLAQAGSNPSTFHVLLSRIGRTLSKPFGENRDAPVSALPDTRFSESS